MLDTELRTMIDEVKDGRLSRRGFVQRMVGARPDGADGDPDSGARRRGHGAERRRLQADQARRRRPAEGAVVAGRRPCSIRISRSAPRTRTARASSTSRSPAGTPTAISCRSSPPRFPDRENGGLAADGKSVTWKLKQGVKWHDGKPFTADDVRLQLGIRQRSGDRGGDHRHLQGHQGREGRRPHGPRPVHEADAVLGRRLRRRAAA